MPRLVLLCGRLAHDQLAAAPVDVNLREIAQDLADVSTVEQAPSIEGRTMFMMLAPMAKAKKKATGKEASAEAETPETP